MARPKKPKSAVESLKDSLYSRESAPEQHPEDRTPLLPSDIHPPVAWDDAKVEQAPKDLTTMQPMKKKKKLSLATKFFISSSVFFLAAASVAAYMFYYGNNTISPFDGRRRQGVDIPDYRR